MPGVLDMGLAIIIIISNDNGPSGLSDHHHWYFILFTELPSIHNSKAESFPGSLGSNL